MSGRKLNAHEQKLHQAALADPKKTLTQKECDTLVPDAAARTDALNFLLGTGLLKAMKDTKGMLSFRAVMKKELEVKKDMTGEEAMILSYIQAAKNEGIWTKHLKAKTELHQTVIDRCLKSLVQKQLIKSVKSVKYPTRKIYMLYHLDPSVEMTGGPWYTDNELDTEFIKLLCSACLRFVRDRSTPKQKGADSSATASQLLYPISAAPSYPTAPQILTFLSKSRITETELTVEHVEMLLNVLVLDGDIERVPAFGAAMWDTSDKNAAHASDASEGDDDDHHHHHHARAKEKKRKRKGREEDSPKRDRKRSKRSRSSSGARSDPGSESDSEDERAREKERKQKRKKSKSHAVSSDDGVSEDDGARRKRKKRRARDNSADEDEDVEMSDAERKGRRRHKSTSKRKRHAASSPSSSSDSDAESDSDDERHSRSRSKSKSSTRSKRKRSASPVDVTASYLQEGYGAYVYRAIRQERVAAGGGGLAQTPCVRCPTFEFCREGGPVNPKECTYYTGWLAAADVAQG